MARILNLKEKIKNKLEFVSPEVKAKYLKERERVRGRIAAIKSGTISKKKITFERTRRDPLE